MSYLLALLIILFASPAWAQCTGSTPTFNCTSSTTVSQLQTCINGAVDGDTINLAAGSYDWSAGGVSWTDKNVKIIGAGIGSTNIDTGALAGFTIANDTAGKANWRISGISFTGIYQPVVLAAIIITNSGAVAVGTNSTTDKGWRIDHVDAQYVHDTAYIPLFIGTIGMTYGVIDSSTFSGTNGFAILSIAPYMVAAGDSTTVSPFLGGYDHAQGVSLGDIKAIYFENNTVNFTGTNQSVVNSAYGGRYVGRYNNVTGSMFQAHDAAGFRRGPVQYEYYNNAMVGGSTPFGHPFLLRGGTGVVFNNTISGFTSNEVALGDERANGTEGGPLGNCNTGVNPYDGNLGDAAAPGWPCLDQIGRGSGAIGSQASFPLYLWNNTSLIIVGSPSVPAYIKATAHSTGGAGNGDIDYCDAGTGAKPASCGTHTLTYAAYTCPHPLTGLAEGCNASTIGTAGYNTEVEDPPDTTAPAISAFTVPSSNVGYAVPVTLTCTDAIGVTGWCLVETDSYAGCSWVGAVITSKTFSTQGAKTLFAFCRDGSGNVSASSTDSVTVTSGRGATFTVR
jgi:hypothetical protein